MLFTRIWPNRLVIKCLEGNGNKYLTFAPICTVCSQLVHSRNFCVDEILQKVLPCKPTSKLLTINYFAMTSMFVISQAKFSKESTEEVDAITYENVCEETLDSLCEFFEDIVEKFPTLKSADVVFGDGVLTVNLEKFGTYVINRQSPNKQIWLSSPTSGPKRYDFVPSRNTWVYRHNDQTLHSLLQEELSDIVNSPVDLQKCAYSGGFK